MPAPRAATPESDRQPAPDRRRTEHCAGNVPCRPADRPGNARCVRLGFARRTGSRTPRGHRRCACEMRSTPTSSAGASDRALPLWKPHEEIEDDLLGGSVASTMCRLDDVESGSRKKFAASRASSELAREPRARADPEPQREPPVWRAAALLLSLRSVRARAAISRESCRCAVRSTSRKIPRHRLGRAARVCGENRATMRRCATAQAPVGPRA